MSKRLSQDQKEILWATSRVRGITFTQIKRMNLYRPMLSLHSLLSNGWLKATPYHPESHLQREQFLLTERALIWMKKYPPNDKI